MQLSPAVIIDQALSILAAYGLGDVSIRRIANALTVAPAALYWHFPNKQALLAGVADELLRPLFEDEVAGDTALAASDDGTWRDDFIYTAEHLYHVCTQCRDAAEVISAALPTGLVTHDPRKLFTQIIPTQEDGTSSTEAIAEATTNFIIGQAMFEQAQQNIAEVDQGVLPTLGPLSDIATRSTFFAGKEPNLPPLSSAIRHGIEVFALGISTRVAA